MLNFMNVERTDFTEKVLKEQKVPRSKVADGIDLENYRRYWTKPIEQLTESDELDIRKAWVENLVSDDIYKIFERIS